MNVSVTTDIEGPLANVCAPPSRLPDAIHPAVEYVQAGVVLATMILAVSMNGFVVFLVARYKVLHKMAFFLALQLIIAHLVFSVTVLPFTFVTAVLREWRLGLIMCQLLGSIHDAVITSRYLLTFVLTIDRVISVFRPFLHLRHGGKISICNSMIAWTISITRSLTSLEGVLSCTKYVPTFKMCSGAPFCSEICRAHTLFFSALLAVFGVVIPFLLYALLFCKGKVISYRFRNSIRAVQLPPAALAPSKPKGLTDPELSSCLDPSAAITDLKVDSKTAVLDLVGIQEPTPIRLPSLTNGVSNRELPDIPGAIADLKVNGKYEVIPPILASPLLHGEPEPLSTDSAHAEVNLKANSGTEVKPSLPAPSSRRKVSELPDVVCPSVAVNVKVNNRTEQHNHRATWTFVILTAVIIGFALPPYILYTAENVLGSSLPVLTILQIIVGRTLIYGLAVADPIVILRNRDIRELFQRIRPDGSVSFNTQLCRFSSASISASS